MSRTWLRGLLTPMLVVVLALGAAFSVGTGLGSAEAQAAQVRPAAVSVAKPTVIRPPVGSPIVVRNLKQARELKDASGSTLRRNLGWRVVVNFPYFRIACPIGIVSGVVWAVYNYRNSTGRWPSFWDVVRWTGGACG